MTREEAIKVIRKMLAYTDLSVRANLTADMVDACHLAIKILEQEPCEDVISRQYLLDNCVIDKVTMPYVPVSKIENAPPVTPQTECLKTQAKKQAMPMLCDDCCYEPNSPFCEMYRKDICEKKDERQSGKWITDRCDMYICSKCNHTYTDLSGGRYGMNFCPNCGAKMVEPLERSDYER